MSPEEVGRAAAQFLKTNKGYMVKYRFKPVKFDAQDFLANEDMIMRVDPSSDRALKRRLTGREELDAENLSDDMSMSAPSKRPRLGDAAAGDASSHVGASEDEQSARR
jgi:hypothetical protein